MEAVASHFEMEAAFEANSWAEGGREEPERGNSPEQEPEAAAPPRPPQGPRDNRVPYRT